MHYKALIVDDDPIARKVLAHYLQCVPQIEMAGDCGNALQAIDTVNNIRPDLLFLDVEMPKLIGTDLARILQPSPKIIFTTAHPNFAAEAFELGAVDYLIKPFSFERFLKSISRFYSVSINASLEGRGCLNDYLSFRTDRKTVRVPLESITFIESFKDYIVIHRLNDSELRAKQTINSVEFMLPKKMFLRIHRSFIISVQKVTAYTNYHVELGKTEIPIGRKYKGTFPGWEG
ncbi:LytR/AlgR family response regulator transcription factor [Salinimicrobium sp. CAU 1759]